MEITIKCTPQEISEILDKYSEDTQIFKFLDKLDVRLCNSKNSAYIENFAKKKTNEQRALERNVAISKAFDEISYQGAVRIKALASYVGVCEKTIKRRLNEHGDYVVIRGIAYKLEE